MTYYLRAALTYFVFGALWIILSDLVVETDPFTAQTAKGLLFVAASAVLIYFLVRREGVKVERERAWYRSLFDRSPDAVFVLGADDRILHANRTARTLYGRDFARRPPLGLNALRAPDFAYLDESDSPSETGSTTSFATSHVRHDGTVFPVLELLSPIELDKKTLRLLVVRDQSNLTASERARRDSEGFLRAIVACSPLALYSVDSDGNVQVWNESAERIFGWTAAEVMGRPLPIVPEQKLDEYQAIRERIVQGIPVVGLELARQRRDGSPIDISLSAARLLDRTGRLTGLVAIAQDITDRRRREAALADSEARYRSLFEGTEAIMLIINPEDGAILDANPAATRFYGWSRDELHRMRASDISTLPPEDVATRLEETRKERKSYFGSEHRLADGSMREVDVFSGLIRIDGGDRIYSIVVDVTERNRAFAALSESEARWQRGVAASPFPIALHAADGAIIQVNPAWEALSGYTHADIPTVEAWIRFAFPGKEGEMSDHIHALFHLDDARREGEFEITCKDGSVRLWDFWTMPTGTLPDGRRTVVCMAIDITERRATENRLIRIQRLESVGRLAGGVAHDFNNLLTLILGRAEQALASSPPEPLGSHLEEIRITAERSAGLTRQLLAFARIQTARPEALSLGSQVSRLMPALRALVGEHRRLEWEPGGGADGVFMDAAQFDQVLVNLCTNARDATSATGRVTISTHLEDLSSADIPPTEMASAGRYARLRVQDDGQGMDERTMAHLFEPFFTTKAPGKGTGLGLSSVYGVVKQNSGFVRVESKPGAGTVIDVFLPFHPLPIPAGTVPERPAVAPTSGSERILLVDDEGAVRALTADLLTGLGYLVITAADADEALAIAEDLNGEIDLLITDVMLPGMNGSVLATRLGARWPGLKVLYTSGYAADIVSEQGVLRADIEFLEKPFTLKSLASGVRRVLEDP